MSTDRDLRIAAQEASAARLAVLTHLANAPHQCGCASDIVAGTQLAPDIVGVALGSLHTSGLVSRTPGGAWYLSCASDDIAGPELRALCAAVSTPTE